MVEVNEELTRHVARLSRLKLSDSEVITFTSQLGEILKYVEQLQSAAVDGVEPLTHPFALETPLRPDVIVPSPVDENGKPKVLQSAPEVMFEGFKVPPIL
jgi:aspartyl-tRNA(Asn)/glutamyl-tRNA(Gln) amidotransferase subunit C